MSEEIDDLIVITENKKTRYLVPEAVYDCNHPDVVYYTKYFSERAQKKENVFLNIDMSLQEKTSLVCAEKVAGIWSEFSRFVPAFIAKGVSLATHPEHQYYLIQIAYDELGGQDKNRIHSRLFLDMLRKADIEPKITFSLSAIKELLTTLSKTLEATRTPAGIMGLFLSFEIIAENNIETIFRALSVDSVREKILSDSLFFQIHRADETEHIRHSVANFLRFNKSQESVEEAEDFFDAGICFWKNFWDKTSEVILHD